ncbi:similar to TGF beta receptor associated protein 1 [Plenodomus lingam JN3]|uniref:Similar to TGF beta receptor associated protein 1 n=1 Tax=Leptosphaeria maculans (strain JN3 / isolate v23.1.3 / race Av1-4-5-6-7-8) TaxID=985895 RepID=E5A7T9_LEPMJ|nr:similar to TGF beta receptor associated protein 1 [Plenodomus lingam JN3]CBX99684.1 similar to TGF beta receptor associated protein 1 [Plenodomus lingam JN3]
MADDAPFPPEQWTARPYLGPYLLRKLVSDLPLSADADASQVHISCVEVWNGNLYVGTSAAEILHFVLLPPPDSGHDVSEEPTAIIASRLEPPHNDATGPGVQQILILPRVNKACVLCNNTLSIYSLPELSPDSTFKPISCLWVGGVDLNEDVEEGGDGVVVVIGLKKRLRLVQISEHHPPKAIKAIEYGGCLLSVRRDAFSCAADAHSYALLDVENQQKIGLFPISSLDPDVGDVGGAAENIATVPQLPSRSVSSASTAPAAHADARGHVRSTSLNVLGLGRPSSRTASPQPPGRRYGFDVPESLSRDMSPVPAKASALATDEPSERASSRVRSETVSRDKPLPAPPEEHPPQMEEPSAPDPPPFIPLKPLIASPNPNEFLLTVGTTPSEQAVGMFVNLDGDMCRGSIQFSSYPDAIVTDGSGIDLSASMRPDMNAEEGYVLAVVHEEGPDGVVTYRVEVQRWDVDPGAGDVEKEWLDFSALGPIAQADATRSSLPLGMRTVVQPYDLVLPEIGAKLSVQRLNLGPTSDDEVKAETAQAKADRDFTDRLSKLQAQTVIWAGDQIWWTVRNPLMTRLDSRIEEAQYTATGDGQRIQPNRSLLEQVLGDIRGQEPRNESEYLSLIYIRQKASLMLFMDVVLRTKTNIIIFESEKRITEQALIEGEIDPRVVLSLLPTLNTEVVQGPEGIQISGGITTLVEQFLQQNDLSSMSTDVNGPFGDNLLQFVKRYLHFWKRRKGMASVTNDPYVFRTVDAALLHILLLLDQRSPAGTSSPGSHRAELNELVDREVECFDRAVELLEQFKRLFLLSRLYQSNCKASLKAAKVLATWKRIIEGEEDTGGELVDGEQRVREYLARIRDQSLVEEYGTWLANRNPKLGVQIFADDSSRVKFEPTRAVALLREKAPSAVKEYLEYLVFGKKHTQYINELLTFYLTTILTELSTTPSSRTTLRDTYSTYRILEPPKPTYHSFITDNASPDEWWQARLRLLQLLSQTSDYDVHAILEKLQPYEADLVPEMIILNGRQGRDQEALRLLTHGLGDYDTALSYCLYGYSSIFQPRTPSPTNTSTNTTPSRTHQSHLFTHLLAEFLAISDLSQRVHRTSELLERFGGWLDVADVLAALPDDWSVLVFRNYLVASLRRLVRERAESQVGRALCDVQNFGAGWELVCAREGGGRVERESGVEGGWGG